MSESSSSKALGLIVDIALLKGLTDAITLTDEELLSQEEIEKKSIQDALCTKDQLTALIDQNRQNAPLMQPNTGIMDTSACSDDATKVFV